MKIWWQNIESINFPFLEAFGSVTIFLRFSEVLQLDKIFIFELIEKTFFKLIFISIAQLAWIWFFLVLIAGMNKIESFNVTFGKLKLLKNQIKSHFLFYLDQNVFWFTENGDESTFSTTFKCCATLRTLILFTLKLLV